LLTGSKAQQGKFLNCRKNVNALLFHLESKLLKADPEIERGGAPAKPSRGY
jgi:hypothetical protein